MHIRKIAEKRIEDHNLTIEDQEKRLSFITDKNCLEAKIIKICIEKLKH